MDKMVLANTIHSLLTDAFNTSTSSYEKFCTVRLNGWSHVCYSSDIRTILDRKPSSFPQERYSVGLDAVW